MTFDVNLSITGIQEAQDDNVRMIAALEPSGALGESLRFVVVGMHRHAVAITHVDTGALKASHRMGIELANLFGEIYIDPASVNPRSKVKPEEYGVYEHNRGGSHAFYDRTRREVGPALLTQAEAMIWQRAGL